MTPATVTWVRTSHHSSVFFNLGRMADSAQAEQILFSAFGPLEALYIHLTNNKDLLAEVLFIDPKIREQAITAGFLHNKKRIVGTPGLPNIDNIVKINLYNIPNCFPEEDLQEPLFEAFQPHGKVIHLKIYLTPLETFRGEAVALLDTSAFENPVPLTNKLQLSGSLFGEIKLRVKNIPAVV